jgi:hypothetical protein
MKYLLLLVFISSILFSRDNPFVPTQTFVDEKESILETKSTPTIASNTNIKKKQITNQINIDTNADVNTEKDIMVSANKIKIRKPKVISKPINIKKNILPKNIKNDNINEEIISDEKTLINHIKPFPYLEVFEYKNSIVIKSQYKIIKKFMLYKPYKIAIDFKANVPEQSKVVRLKSLFDKFVFGNHPKSGFFRIVMYPKENPYHYERIYTDYTITIKKK